jgi:hypothetical protein
MQSVDTGRQPSGVGTRSIDVDDSIVGTEGMLREDVAENGSAVFRGAELSIEPTDTPVGA